MCPTLQNGQLMLTVRLPKFLLKTGMLAIVDTDNHGAIVKRLDVVGASVVILSSDNKNTTSQYCGVPLPLNWVKSVVLWRFGSNAFPAS